jgi:mRNA interferase MazF
VVVAVTIRRGDVLLVELDPTRGSKIRKTRPCLVVSPDELNEHLSTYIVAPLTTGGRTYPFRISCRFESKAGYIIADQLRTIDRDRVVRNLGKMSNATVGKTLLVLQDMFRP